MAEYRVTINPGIQESTEVEHGIPLVDRRLDGTANTATLMETLTGVLGIYDLNDLEREVAERALVARRHYNLPPMADEPIYLSHRDHRAAFEQMHYTRKLLTPIIVTKVTESIVPGETGQSPRPLEDSLVISSLRRNLWILANSSSKSFDRLHSNLSHSPVSIHTLQIANTAQFMNDQVTPVIMSEFMTYLQLQEMMGQSHLAAAPSSLDKAPGRQYPGRAFTYGGREQVVNTGIPSEVNL